jgi:3-oxoacyl-[acyl-carrier protein] reductase
MRVRGGHPHQPRSRIVDARLQGDDEGPLGRIISITSVVGVTGNPGQAITSLRKRLDRLTKAVAQNCEPRITVNAVAPGFMTCDDRCAQ